MAKYGGEEVEKKPIVQRFMREKKDGSFSFCSHLSDMNAITQKVLRIGKTLTETIGKPNYLSNTWISPSNTIYKI